MAATITIDDGGGGAGLAVISTKEGGPDIRRPDRAPAASVAASMASVSGSSLTVGRVPLLSTLIDCLLVVLLGLAILFTYLFGQPYQRGFFCDDDSIRLSLKGDTVVPALLIVMSVLVPTVTVCACEAAAAAREGPAGRERRVALWRLALPAWAARASWALCAFLFGLGAQQLLVDAGKYSIGRLRPHFLDACRPAPPVAALCAGPDVAQHRYVTAFTCTGDESVSREARLSFPSGHSSMSFYAAVFTALFLERRFRWRRRARLQVAFAQLLAVLLAWLTALSRVSDHKHHWSDVLAGGALGALVAAITVVHFLRLRGDAQPAGRAGAATYVFGDDRLDAVVVSGSTANGGARSHRASAAASAGAGVGAGAAA
ncbi:hypothetical protein R5R35_014627 [Gryllus longicercus]|uniref:Phosphatidic acid phosphatase type 2/haloperoxidase domain-containing protein n=1 Tax=Gryllus longicercus TaxID=2509291 RepID=A0AAN9VLP1_9ORTH